MGTIFDSELDTFNERFNNLKSNYKDPKILLSYSGGSDSDVMLSLFRETNNLKDVRIVFFDTGIELDATKKHIATLKQEGVNIETIRPKIPVSLCAKKFGQPFINKYVSDMLERLQKVNFDFKVDGLLEYDILLSKFPKSITALRWWCNYYGSKFDTNEKTKSYVTAPEKSSFNIARNRYLKEYILEHGLDFKVSFKCCKFAKKDTSRDFEKDFKPSFIVIGVRRSEGGIRSKVYTKCFIDNDGHSKWMPILYWDDSFKQRYIENKNIILSDAYTKYKLKRTGCAGCPLNRNLEYEKEILAKYEPNLFNGVSNIFKDTYRNTINYNKFKLQKKSLEATNESHS